MYFHPVKQQTVSVQVAAQIQSSILSGDFSPGERLPSERELAEMFKVSRPSVRGGLNILASSGLITSTQGSGTVVLSLLNNSANNYLQDKLCA